MRPASIRERASPLKNNTKENNMFEVFNNLLTIIINFTHLYVMFLFGSL